MLKVFLKDDISGCQYVDVAENFARLRARFFMPEGCDIGANVQPHSGAKRTAVFAF